MKICGAVFINLIKNRNTGQAQWGPRMDHGNPEILKALLFNFYRLYATMLIAPLVNHPLCSRALQRTLEFCAVPYFPCMDIMEEKNELKRLLLKETIKRGTAVNINLTSLSMLSALCRWRCAHLNRVPGKKRRICQNKLAWSEDTWRNSGLQGSDTT